MQTATLSSKFQITIPKQVRDELAIEPGMKFMFASKGNVIMLVPEASMEDLRGILVDADIEIYRDRGDRF